MSPEKTDVSKALNIKEIVQERVSVGDLKLGMYVCQLDRPWLETRFLMQGFYLNTVEEIRELQSLCRYVYVDSVRGVKPVRSDKAAFADSSSKPSALDYIFTAVEKKPAKYKDSSSFEEELPRAREAHTDLTQVMENVLEDIQAGKTVQIDQAKEVIKGMIDSVLRNPDAFLWLTKLKTKDQYTYAHSIDASTLAVSYSRHLGLPKPVLEQIALGTLLFDIGKLKLPQDLLNSPEKLSPEEFEIVKQHVPEGLKLVENIKGINLISTEIIHYHHERHNGTGYPNGLCGFNIPVYSRIAALVDCYDAIISDRPYAPGIHESFAIQKLYEWRGIDFQEDMVEQFIQCLGAYPTGSLVELSNGSIGIVMAQNRVRRLRPKVMLVLDENKQPYDFAPVVDLAIDTDEDEPLRISRAVNPDDFGIDPREFYLN